MTLKFAWTHMKCKGSQVKLTTELASCLARSHTRSQMKFKIELRKCNLDLDLPNQVIPMISVCIDITNIFITDQRGATKYVQLKIFELWEQKLCCCLNALLEFLLFLTLQLWCQQLDVPFHISHKLLLVKRGLFLKKEKPKNKKQKPNNTD